MKDRVHSVQSGWRTVGNNQGSGLTLSMFNRLRRYLEFFRLKLSQQVCFRHLVRVSSPSSLSKKSACLAFATGVTALAVDIRRLRGAFTLHAAVGFAIPDLAGTIWMCTLF